MKKYLYLTNSLFTKSWQPDFSLLLRLEMTGLRATRKMACTGHHPLPRYNLGGRFPQTVGTAVIKTWIQFKAFKTSKSSLLFELPWQFNVLTEKSGLTMFTGDITALVTLLTCRLWNDLVVQFKFKVASWRWPSYNWWLLFGSNIITSFLPLIWRIKEMWFIYAV